MSIMDIGIKHKMNSHLEKYTPPNQGTMTSFQLKLKRFHVRLIKKRIRLLINGFSSKVG